MKANYYYLKPLAARLNGLLKGLVLAECFSQDKDEVILGFSRAEKTWRKQRDFYLRASLRPDFVALSFPPAFRRAGRNTIDLFEDLIGTTVEAVGVFENERAFFMAFQENKQLVFKLFSNRSNLLLVENGQVTSVFNTRLKADFSLDVRSLHRPIDQSEAAFRAGGGDYRRLFPTFGREVRDRLDAAGHASLPERWQQVQAVVQQLESPVFTIRNEAAGPQFSLLPQPGQPVFTDPLEAANAYVCLLYTSPSPRD